MRRGEGTALACRRHARWRRCRCGWAPPSGAAASAGGAVPPGGRPCGGGFARGSSGGRRRASLPCGGRRRASLPCGGRRRFLSAVGAAALRRLCPWGASPAGSKPAASRPPAGYCRHSACACAGAVLPGCGCRCRWLQACRSRAATVAALPRFCVNDFDVNILPKHNTRSSKPIIRTNNLALIPLLGNHGGDITCAAEEQENKNTRFPKRCSSSCEDWCAKSVKTQNCV